MDKETRKSIDSALKTNNEITAKMIALAKSQEKMICDLFAVIEEMMEKMDNDSA